MYLGIAVKKERARGNQEEANRNVVSTEEWDGVGDDGVMKKER